VDCDFADHFRFQATKDLDAATGAWLRCLAHSRAQEQDGRVTLAWLRRNFATSFDRIEDLVAVGLLHVRADGDYEIHRYAPRNQTRTMAEEARLDARLRMRASRKRKAARASGGNAVVASRPSPEGQHAPLASDAESVAVAPIVAPNACTNGAIRRRVSVNVLADRSPTEACSGGVATPAQGSVAPILPSSSVFSDSAHADGNVNGVEEMSPTSQGMDEEDVVTPNKRACSDGHVHRNIAVTGALVPTSTSTSILNSISSSSDPDLHNATVIHSSHEGEAGEGSRGEAGGGLPAEHGGAAGAPASGRRPLPPSERRLWGSAWLEAFTAGVAAHTGRPCTAGPMFLATLERIVSHHAPQRDAASACAFLRAEAEAFARQWEGKFPAKGLTPDGLERWLNDGRHGPPEFGRPRIVQLPPEEWHEDDWSDLNVTVLK
jgi:hypothetical protein